MRVTPTLLGVLVAGLAILVAPWVNVTGYTSIRHSISELGAQGAPNAWIMNAGFLAFGAGVLVDAARSIRQAVATGVLFLVFGVAMMLAGVFAHRPIDPAAAYSVREDDLHSLASSVAGASFALGVLAYGWTRRKLAHLWAHGPAIAAALLLPLGMIVLPETAGALQRVMFLVSFVWLAVFLPRLLGQPDD
jgi:hypothetical membrane protein